MLAPRCRSPSIRILSWAVFAFFASTAAVQAATITYTLNDYTHVSGRTYKATTPWGVVTATNADYFKYDGEGYVIGPAGNPITLADLNGDKPFLNSFGSDRFSVSFPFKIFSVEFDYQIFPDASTPANNTSSSWPDFKFYADGQFQFKTLAVIPPTGSRSTNNTNETEPQFIGNSGLWLFPNGVNTLDFVDWPPTIGVANLRFGVTQNDPAVPEPPTWILTSLLLLSLGAFRFVWKLRAPSHPHGAAA